MASSQCGELIHSQALALPILLRLSRSCAHCEVSSPDGRANIAVARASSKSKQGRTKERNPRKIISGARNRWKSGVSHPADLSSHKRRRDRVTRSEEMMPDFVL